jgi:UPF0755 protein
MFTPKIKIIIFITTIILLIIAGVSLLNRPLISKDQSGLSFIFKPGTSLTQLANSLHEQRALKYPRLLIFLSNLTGSSTQLKAGEYEINHQTTLWQLWSQLKRGPTTPYSFTIIEGWTFNNLLDSLENNPNIIHTINGLKNDEIMKLIGHEGEMPEGRFFPDTYKFSHNTKDVDILLRAYLLMETKLNQLWPLRNSNVPYNCPYKVLIVASIIEKEASLLTEFPIISGVILRRLQQGMYLQADPTIIYGLGLKYKGRLTNKDLQIDTPYNTYLHKQLPPTPICSPGEKTIYAAMHPDNSTFLYYVAKGDGGHEFSSTLDEHNLAVKKYQLDKAP